MGKYCTINVINIGSKAKSYGIQKGFKIRTEKPSSFQKIISSNVQSPQSEVAAGVNGDEMIFKKGNPWRVFSFFRHILLHIHSAFFTLLRLISSFARTIRRQMFCRLAHIAHLHILPGHPSAFGGLVVAELAAVVAPSGFGSAVHWALPFPPPLHHFLVFFCFSPNFLFLAFAQWVDPVPAHGSAPEASHILCLQSPFAELHSELHLFALVQRTEAGHLKGRLKWREGRGKN